MVHLLCEWRAARAHRDIPCIIIIVSALAGGEEEEEEEEDGDGKRRDFLSIPDWNTGWRVTSEGFLRHVPAAPVCPALAGDESPLLSEERRRINSRGQPSGMIRRDETPWRAYGRVKGCGISPPLPIGTPFSRAFASRITPCVELIMKFLETDLRPEI